MASLTYDTFIVNLAGEIDGLTNHFVFDGYNALVSLLKAPLGAMIILYIVLMGYAIVRGMVQTPQQELFKFAIRAGIIYMTAMDWGFFAAHIKDLFVVGSDSISTTLMRAVHQQAMGRSVNQGLQNVLNDILTLGSTLFDAGSRSAKELGKTIIVAKLSSTTCWIAEVVTVFGDWVIKIK